MKYRKLRIAFSTICALICVSLIALWMQSYNGHAFLTRRMATYTLSLRAEHGELGIWSVSPTMAEGMLLANDWNVNRLPVTDADLSQLIREEAEETEFFGFRYADLPPLAHVLFIPFWALLLPVALAGMLPWIKLRIGWRTAASSVCVLATLLLVAFWIRSYKWVDITDRMSAINVCSMNGKLLIGESLMIMGNDTLKPGAPIPESHLGICSLRHDRFDLVPLGSGIAIPYWLFVVVFAPIAAFPWLRLRFSLRTMLIATALIAIVLTAAIYGLRR